MKPLVRWTVGGTNNKLAFDCLRKSINNFVRLYGKKFDYVICYNNCKKANLPQNIELFDQSLYSNSLPYPPIGNSWKLYPPRLRVQSHEIFIDNDVIIYNPIEQLDDFLRRQDTFVASEALKKNDNIYMNMLAAEAPAINTGFLGLPPHFDFGSEIQKKIISPWSHIFDEQGLTNLILTENLKASIISLDQIWVASSEYRVGTCGTHFVGLNSIKCSFYKQFIKNIFL